MADTAPVTQYKSELVAAFEVGWSALRTTTIGDGVTQGNQYVFNVAGSGGATAVTRGVNGLIPARSDSNTQSTLSLVEWHKSIVLH